MKNYHALLIALLLLSSCSAYLSPYTAKVQNETNLDEEQLKEIQFYLSHTIVLYRYLSNVQTEIENGNLKVIDGRQVEEIIIEGGTPGVVVGKDKNGNMLVSFDADNHVLRFGVNYNSGGRYTLMAKQWDGKTGIVEYGNNEYRTSPESSFAYLMLDIKQVNHLNVESREAAGRSLDP